MRNKVDLPTKLPATSPEARALRGMGCAPADEGAGSRCRLPALAYLRTVVSFFRAPGALVRYCFDESTIWSNW